MDAVGAAPGLDKGLKEVAQLRISLCICSLPFD